jgi:hypothetical protein
MVFSQSLLFCSQLTLSTLLILEILFQSLSRTGYSTKLFQLFTYNNQSLTKAVVSQILKESRELFDSLLAVAIEA